MSQQVTSFIEMNDDSDLIYEKKEDPEKYFPDRFPESPIHYMLRTISYSTLLTFHSCPRRFELSRLIPTVGNQERDEDADGHLDFGTVVGNGLQEFLVSKDINRALFRMFLDWNDNLESERGMKSAKTFWDAIRAIKAVVELTNGPLAQYEVAVFNGKPAVELGFRIDFGDGFTYRGKLDALLIHKVTREFLPLECKTTGSRYLDEAMYMNSSQGIGYGVVIDRVAHEMEVEYNSYDVFYPVYMTFKAEWVPFKFHKTNTARALWLQSILFDINHIVQYAEANYFPMRGESCFHFGRQCRFFGTCNMSNNQLVGSNAPVKLDKRDDYSLEFDIFQLVEAQVGKE